MDCIIQYCFNPMPPKSSSMPGSGKASQGDSHRNLWRPTCFSSISTRCGSGSRAREKSQARHRQPALMSNNPPLFLAEVCVIQDRSRLGVQFDARPAASCLIQMRQRAVGTIARIFCFDAGDFRHHRRCGRFRLRPVHRGKTQLTWRAHGGEPEEVRDLRGDCLLPPCLGESVRERYGAFRISAQAVPG